MASGWSLASRGKTCWKSQSCRGSPSAKERTRWGIVGAIIVVFAVVVILLNTNLFYSGKMCIRDSN